MALICYVRDLHESRRSWLDYSLNLLADDRKLGVEQAVTTHSRWTKHCAERRAVLWLESTEGMPRMYIGEEDDRRRLVDSVITDGSFQLSSTV